MNNKWYKTWMDLAIGVSVHSHHPTIKVGAVIVTADNTQVLSLGFNGNYKGGENRPFSTEIGMSMLIHAEENSLIKMDYNNPKDKVMYVTHSPCLMCSKKIINAGINTVIYDVEYRDRAGIELLDRVGIPIFKYSDL